MCQPIANRGEPKSDGAIREKEGRKADELDDRLRPLKRRFSLHVDDVSGQEK
jgi:hypothetical protein